MKKRSSVLGALLVGLLILTTSGIAAAKSLYVIRNIGGNPTPIGAYDIKAGGNLSYQTQYGVPYHSGGGVGMAIDTDNKFLFVVYEFSNTIQIVNAETMVGAGSITFSKPGSSAGIVYDHPRKRVYAVSRGSRYLYAFNWNPTTKTLTQVGGTIYLASGTSAYGLAMDETAGKLYVGGYNNTVYTYDVTNNFAQSGSITVGNRVIGIDVDTTRKHVYTTAGWAGYETMCRHDLTTAANTCVNVGARTLGVAVDVDTGYSYVTTYRYGSNSSVRGYLVVYDASLKYVEKFYQGRPTDVIVPDKDVSYNPLGLTKDDGLDYDTECAGAGQNVTYTIGYDSSANTQDITGVVLTDTLPADMTFVSASGGGSYDSGTGKVTWNVGTVTAGSTGSVTLTVTVKSSATPGGEILNHVGLTSDQTPATSKTEKTKVCTNRPPVAQCQNVTTQAGVGCVGCATVDNGSYDPDGDPITITYSPQCDYALGATTVTLTVKDDKMAEDSCTGVVTVVDTVTPTLECNTTAITPKDAPISFTATASDYCPVTVTASNVTCTKVNKNGKVIDKSGSCVVATSGPTVTITDVGGVGTTIAWTITAVDSSFNVTTKACSVTAGNPGNSGCNQGVGNGPEGCDPGNSNQGNPDNSNDENGGTPGNPGKKGGKK